MWSQKSEKRATEARESISPRDYVTLDELIEAPNPLELFDTMGANATTTTGMSSNFPPPPDTVAMKEARKQSTVAVGVAGGVTGLLLGGPIVGAIAGFITAAVTKRTLKKREKKVLCKYQQELAEMLSPKVF